MARFSFAKSADEWVGVLNKLGEMATIAKNTGDAKLLRQVKHDIDLVTSAINGKAIDDTRDIVSQFSQLQKRLDSFDRQNIPVTGSIDELEKLDSIVQNAKGLDQTANVLEGAPIDPVKNLEVETTYTKRLEDFKKTGKKMNPDDFPEFYKDGVFQPNGYRQFETNLLQSLNDKTMGLPNWIRANPKLSGTIILGVTVGSIMINADLKAKAINNKSYNITSIEINKDDPEKTTIIFDPQGDAIVPGDEIYIQESNSIPGIDGLQKPVKFNVSGITEIKKKITTNGAFGILKIKTSMQNRAKDTAEQIGKGVGAAAGGITGGVLNELFKSIGLGGIGDVAMYISIGLLVCCLLSSILASVILVMRYGD